MLNLKLLADTKTPFTIYNKAFDTYLFRTDDHHHDKDPITKATDRTQFYLEYNNEDEEKK
jgi:hypothetical protein